tara:strand:+ start:320 stop:3052 length:2733 start_codon:yes stop_codon:yes gene_type:complete
MPRLSIRDFSGGLVSNQSEFDLQENQYQQFDVVVNKTPGRVEKPSGETIKSASEAGSQVATEFASYRTEKDASDADTSTVWWVAGNGSTVKRQDVSTGTGGSWSSISSDFSSGTPVFDFLIHNQALRISDGSFANNSQWYGHIKRNVLGQSTGLDAEDQIPKYHYPQYRQTIDDWFLKDAAIPAPTIVKMSMAHDGGDDLSADADVGLFVYEPRHKYDDGATENDEHNAWDNAMDNETFDPADRYALTYLYDYVQESELSRDSDGNIGISGFEVEKGSDEEVDSTKTISEDLTTTEQDITVSDGGRFAQYTYIKVGEEIMFIKYISSNTLYVRRGQLRSQPQEHSDGDAIYHRSSPQKARAINLVLNGITSSGYHNPRITGLNIYWQPKGDPDWYLVETVDMNRGYADSPLAQSPDTDYTGSSSNTAKFYGSNSYNTTAMKNYGYLMPCPKSTTLDDVTSALDPPFTSSTTAWTGTGTDFDSTDANDIAILSRKETNDSGLGTQFNRLGAYHAYTRSSSDTAVVFETNKNINRVFAKYTANTANIDKPNRITTHDTEHTKATTWYIPFDGLKLSTYNSLTGRAAKTKLSAIKWNTSAVVGNRAYYADVDTVDENEQTSREKNRIYFTDPFKMDEILPGRYFDVGRNDGDEIKRLIEYRGRLFVFKTKDTYVYNARHQLERHYVGVGAAHKDAVFETPLGLVCANKHSISAVTPSSVKELSYRIRDTWQGLTLDNPKVGYDAVDNEIIVVYDYNVTTAYVMNVDNGSWIKRGIAISDLMSNFILNNALRPEYINYKETNYSVAEYNTGSQSGTTAYVKTKRYDFGLPEQQKRFSKIHLVYKSSSTVDVEIFIDGEGSASTTLTFSAQASIDVESQPLSVLGKTVEFRVSDASSNFILESMDVDYQILGSNP